MFETQKKANQPIAVVISYSPLLSYTFVNTLLEQGIFVHLANLSSENYSLPLPSEVNQTQNLDLLHQVNNPDYLCIFFPSLGTTEQLHHLRDHLEKTGSKSVVVESYPNQKFEVFPESNSANIRRVLLTDIYGDLRFSSSLNAQAFLRAISKGTKLELANQGQNLLFPTHVSDISDPLLRILFSSGFSHPIYWLSSLDQITELDFVTLAKKQAQERLNKQSSLDFVIKPLPSFVPNRSSIAHTQAVLDWNPTSDLEKSLTSLFVNLSLPPKEIPTPPPTTPIQPTETVLKSFSDFKTVTQKKTTHLKEIIFRNRSKGPLFFGFILLLSLLLSPPLLLVSQAYLGAKHLSSALVALEGSDTTTAARLSNTSFREFSRSRQLLELNQKLYFFLPLEEKLNKHARLLDTGQRLSTIILTSVSTVTQAQDVYSYILGSNQADLSSLLPSLKSNLEKLYTDLSLVEISLQNLSFTSRLPYLETLKSTKEKLPDIRKRIQFGLTVLDLIPVTIAKESSSYLLLLQNNTELRPTGGFINSFAILNFHKGRLADFSVSDIYTADSQLSGQVEPPAPLKAHLDPNWFARDANWYPDFSVSAKQVQWFFQKELNQTFDGVIALDLEAIKELLRNTGPVTDSTGQIINKDNLYQIINQKSQIDFTSPNNTGQDFLTSLLKILLTNLKDTPPPLISLARSLNLSLQHGSLLLSLNDDKLQQLLETRNWSGSLRYPSCPPLFSDIACTNQTFALVEANLGINRSNFYLNRQVTHQIDIGPAGQLTHKITLLYQNTSPDNGWPGGKYKTYTRFYLPLNTRVLGLEQDNQPLTFDTASFATNPNLTEIGFYYEIQSSTTSTLTLSLESSSILSTLTPTSSLSINWERQPGFGSTSFLLKIAYPPFLKPVLLSTPASSQENQLIFNSPFTNDTNFSVKFTRQ